MKILIFLLFLFTVSCFILYKNFNLHAPNKLKKKFHSNQNLLQDFLILKNDKRSSNYDYSVMLVTGQINEKTRLIHIMNTWGKSNTEFHLSVITDSFTSLWNNTLIFPETHGGHKKSQHKWALGLNSIQKKSDWLLVVDDDTFVVHKNLRKLIPKLDPNKTALYGQRCSEHHFCGGSGWLIHWNSLQLMKENVLRHCGLGVDIDFYDVCFPQYMGIEFVHRDEFRAQPPWTYKLQSDGTVINTVSGWVTSAESMKSLVTFHYISDAYYKIQDKLDNEVELWPWEL